MAIYWFAVDFSHKKIIEPPKGFSIVCPSIFCQESPFSGMIIMMNCLGYNFQMVNDSGYKGPDDIENYENITEKTYVMYKKYFEEV